MKATIIGSGIVGSSWAVVFSRAGYRVTLYDTDHSRLTAALDATKLKLSQFAEYNLLNDQSVEEIIGRVSIATDLAVALQDTVYVQECVPELVDIKLSVFAQLDSLAPTAAILASSTSNIPASKFTEQLSNRARCLINPPHIIPLVEIVPAPWTDPDVVQRATTILSEIGQKPVVLKKEVPGFVINRLQYAMLAECFRMIEDEVLSVGDLDASLRYGLAPRWSFMGPVQTIDLNAPNDYCDRYLPGICNLIKTQDNNREFGREMVEKLVKHQRSLYPEDKIPQAIEWRDARLMAQLRHHKEAESTIDQKLFPAHSAGH